MKYLTEFKEVKNMIICLMLVILGILAVALGVIGAAWYLLAPVIAVIILITTAEWLYKWFKRKGL